MGIHLALLQTDIKFCDFEYNAAHVIEMIADAMEKVPRPDVIVLPEDWSSGFSDEMFHHMEEHIEQIGYRFERMCQTVFGVDRRRFRGYPIRRRDEKYYVSH